MPSPRTVARDLLPPDVPASEAKDRLERAKLEAARGGRWKELPTNPDLLSQLDPQERSQRARLYLIKPTRSLSGVSVVAVMTSPFRCPHGKCTYCPGGPEFGTPQSYTG